MKKFLFWSANVFMNVFLLNFVFAIPAKAYIDPSAVSYVIQAVAGVVIAIGACLTIFRHKIAAFFKNKKNETKKEVHFKESETNETEQTGE